MYIQKGREARTGWLHGSCDIQRDFSVQKMMGGLKNWHFIISIFASLGLILLLIIIHLIHGEAMRSNTNILIYLIIFALLDMIIPVPFAAILLIYVLLEKPLWFKKLVAEVYKQVWKGKHWQTNRCHIWKKRNQHYRSLGRRRFTLKIFMNVKYVGLISLPYADSTD